MSRIPVDNPFSVTTAFGVPDSNAKFGKHSGIDYAGFVAGRPVYSPTAGQLTNIVSPTGGNMVVIYDGQYWHRLMHNSSFSRSDGSVREGEQVAAAGTTGLSTGVHCHWDVNIEGVYPTSFAAFIDPNIWLTQGVEMVTNEEDNRQVFLAVVGRNPYDQEVGRYIGKEWSDALKDCETNQDRLNIDKMITVYYDNGSVVPNPGDPTVVVNGQPYVKSK